MRIYIEVCLFLLLPSTPLVTRLFSPRRKDVITAAEDADQPKVPIACGTRRGPTSPNAYRIPQEIAGFRWFNHLLVPWLGLLRVVFFKGWRWHWGRWAPLIPMMICSRKISQELNESRISSPSCFQKSNPKNNSRWECLVWEASWGSLTCSLPYDAICLL